jgi:hypothetical protein
MPIIEPSSVTYIEVAHKFREVRFGCLDQQVEMIRHERIRMNMNPIGPYRILKQFQEFGAIMIGQENRPSLVAPAGNMIESVGKLDP